MTASDASPAGSSRGVVMFDVARVAGVSQKTVSRVVNGAPYVRPDVRERVNRAIEQLGTGQMPRTGTSDRGAWLPSECRCAGVAAGAQPHNRCAGIGNAVLRPVATSLHP